jgi:hypothetical protein
VLHAARHNEYLTWFVLDVSIYEMDLRPAAAARRSAISARVGSSRTSAIIFRL